MKEFCCHSCQRWKPDSLKSGRVSGRKDSPRHVCKTCNDQFARKNLARQRQKTHSSKVLGKNPDKYTAGLLSKIAQ